MTETSAKRSGAIGLDEWSLQTAAIVLKARGCRNENSGTGVREGGGGQKGRKKFGDLQILEPKGGVSDPIFGHFHMICIRLYLIHIYL